MYKNESVFFLKEWKPLIYSLSEENQIYFWNLFMSYDSLSNNDCENEIVKPIWNFVKSQIENNRTRQINLLNQRTSVYIIKMSNPLEEFIKIGISCSVESRIKDYKRLGFYVSIIDVFNFENRLDALEEESNLHKRFKSYSYIPTDQFGGYTECFSNEIINELF